MSDTSSNPGSVRTTMSWVLSPEDDDYAYPDPSDNESEFSWILPSLPRDSSDEFGLGDAASQDLSGVSSTPSTPRAETPPLTCVSPSIRVGTLATSRFKTPVPHVLISILVLVVACALFEDGEANSFLEIKSPMEHQCKISANMTRAVMHPIREISSADRMWRQPDWTRNMMSPLLKSYDIPRFTQLFLPLRPPQSSPVGPNQTPVGAEPPFPEDPLYPARSDYVRPCGARSHVEYVNKNAAGFARQLRVNDAGKLPSKNVPQLYATRRMETDLCTHTDGPTLEAADFSNASDYISSCPALSRDQPYHTRKSAFQPSTVKSANTSSTVLKAKTPMRSLLHSIGLVQHMLRMLPFNWIGRSKSHFPQTPVPEWVRGWQTPASSHSPMEKHSSARPGSPNARAFHSPMIQNGGIQLQPRGRSDMFAHTRSSSIEAYFNKNAAEFARQLRKTMLAVRGSSPSENAPPVVNRFLPAAKVEHRRNRGFCMFIFPARLNDTFAMYRQRLTPMPLLAYSGAMWISRSLMLFLLYPRTSVGGKSNVQKFATWKKSTGEGSTMSPVLHSAMLPRCPATSSLILTAMSRQHDPFQLAAMNFANKSSMNFCFVKQPTRLNQLAAMNFANLSSMNVCFAKQPTRRNQLAAMNFANKSSMNFCFVKQPTRLNQLAAMNFATLSSMNVCFAKQPTRLNQLAAMNFTNLSSMNVCLAKQPTRLNQLAAMNFANLPSMNVCFAKQPPRLNHPVAMNFTNLSSMNVCLAKQPTRLNQLAAMNFANLPSMNVCFAKQPARLNHPVAMNLANQSNVRFGKQPTRLNQPAAMNFANLSSMNVCFAKQPTRLNQPAAAMNFANLSSMNVRFAKQPTRLNQPAARNFANLSSMNVCFAKKPIQVNQPTAAMNFPMAYGYRDGTLTQIAAHHANILSEHIARFFDHIDIASMSPICPQFPMHKENTRPYQLSFSPECAAGVLAYENAAGCALYLICHPNPYPNPNLNLNLPLPLQSPDACFARSMMTRRTKAIVGVSQGTCSYVAMPPPPVYVGMPLTLDQYGQGTCDAD